MSEAGTTGPRPHRPHVDPDGIDNPVAIATTDADRDRRLAAYLAKADDWPATDVDVLRALRAAPVIAIERVVASSNAVFVLDLDHPDPVDPSRLLRAIYKPQRGERPLWDFPEGTLLMRETAAYVVDRSLAFHLIPPTTLRDGPFGPGSVQAFVHPPRERPDSAALERADRDLLRLALLDVVINNADRKRAHLLLDREGRLQAIDNALTFLPYPRQRTVLLGLGGDTAPDDAVRAIRDVVTDTSALVELRGHLTRLLASTEVDAVEARLRELAEDPRYPLLDPWDGRPWEWR